METEKPTRQQSTGIDRVLIPGILAGMVAAVPMALFAMVASGTYQQRGFFSPLYLITSILGDDTIKDSLRQAAEGEAFFLMVDPLVFAVAMHLMLGAFFGGVFAAISQKVPPRRMIPAGIAYGLLVMVLMVFVIVPLADLGLEQGRQLGDLATDSGVLTLVVQHVIYGAILGWWPWLRPRPTLLGLRPAG